MSRVINIVLSLFFLAIVISCKQGDKNKLKEDMVSDNEVSTIGSREVSTIGSRMDSITVYQKRVLESGDTNAYKELQIISLEVPPDDFLFWALTMANKYNYASAYVDVFNILLEANGCSIEDIECLDERTKKFALEYLSEGAKKGDINAKELVEKLKTIE